MKLKMFFESLVIFMKMKSCNLDAQNILTYLAFLAVVVGSHDATLEVAFLFPL